MALVDYPSSDEDIPTEIEETRSNKKRRRSVSSDQSDPAALPPLPSAFHDLYASSTRVSTRDDPSLHNGRKRAIPHIEGNWPAHVYLEWHPTPTEYKILDDLIETANEGADEPIQTLLRSSLGTPLPLHISLSRPLALSTLQKDSFVEQLEKALKASNVRPFSVRFSSVSWEVNYESTRWFLVLRAEKLEGNQLNRLLKVCNQVASDFDQPPLYAEPTSATSERSGSPKARWRGLKTRVSKRKRKDLDIADFSQHFHVSLGWSLAAPNDGLKLINTLPGIHNILQSSIKASEVFFDKVKIKAVYRRDRSLELSVAIMIAKLPEMTSAPTSVHVKKVQEHLQAFDKEGRVS